MEEKRNYEVMFGQFVDYQQKLHENNQKKIKVGLKVNILLPLVFLIISFITSGSKLIFLILWIASLFGIAFYLLYVEYTDFKLQEKMKEFGVVDEKAEQDSLIGAEVVGAVEKLDDIEDLQLFSDVKELRAGIQGDISEIREKIRSNDNIKAIIEKREGKSSDENEGENPEEENSEELNSEEGGKKDE